MKKKKCIFILIAILLGFILGESIYNEYKKNLNKDYNAYLIQIGSFKDDDEVDPSNYLVIKEDDIYNVYAGVTTKLSNAVKIKDIYSSENIEAYIKPVIIDNVEFLNNLEQFDLLLSEVDGKNNIFSINDVIISQYEEIILGK